jgi:small subunit ribosomal protein S9
VSEETPNNETSENSEEQAPQEETPQEETPQEETPQEEAPQGDAPEPPAAESPDETPQTNEPDPETGPDETPAEEPEQPEQPQEQEEQPSADSSAAKKAPAIPGAELEPIAIEEDTSRLSAEEIARREAEAEERAAAEAAATAEGDDEPLAAPKPSELAKDARYIATGKRKNSVARVIIKPGGGAIIVNERPIEEYFPRPQLQTIAKQSLVATGYEGTVDVRVRAHGGGISGQAAAVRHGIAKALLEIDPNLRGELKRRGMLTRDSRVKERRKAGFKKARKRPQFSKR